MRIANRLRYSFGIMLLTVLVIAAVAVGVMLRTATALSTSLQRAFDSVALLESLAELARDHNVVASRAAATATLAAEETQKLDQAEAAIQQALSKLGALDPAASERARAVLTEDLQQTRAAVSPFVEAAPTAAPAPAPRSAPKAPPPAPRRKGKPSAGSAPARAAPPSSAPERSAKEAQLEELQIRLLLLQQGRRAGLRIGDIHQQATQALSTLRDDQQALIHRRLVEVTAEARRFMLALLVLALVAGAGLVFLFAGVRRNVLRPLQSLADGAHRVSAERDLTVAVEVSGDAEVQELGRGFGQMMETLRDLTVNTREATDRLLASSVELGNVTRAQGDTVARQASALEEARRTSSLLLTASRSAASQAEAVLRVAERAEVLGRQGETAMTQDLGAVEVIQNQTHQVVERILRLATSAQRIAAITSTVKGFADQSHVLALNAAIEASRAGEAGLGFGVVAREIRGLADSSIRATVEVRSILAEVLKGIRESAALVEATRAGLEEGTARTRRLGESVAGLTVIVRENLGAVREIAGTVASQGSGIAQISTAVEDLSAMMTETVGSANTTGEAARVLRDISGQVSSAVKVFKT